MASRASSARPQTTIPLSECPSRPAPRRSRPLIGDWLDRYLFVVIDFSLFFYCFFLLMDWNVRLFNSCVKHLEKNRYYFVTIHLRSFLAGVDAIEVV